MHKQNCFALFAFALTTTVAMPAVAFDARSAGLGGSAIAHGKGVHGALENPSSMMRMHREKQRVHLHFGASTDILDDGSLISSLSDDKKLPEQIENELDSFSGSVLTCDITSSPETVCLSGTQRLSELSVRVLDILNRADDSPIRVTAAADLGFAYTQSTYPIALHLKTSATGALKTAVDQGDIAYVNTFATVLADNQLTFDELTQSVPLSISADGQTLSVVQPEDSLKSDAEGSVLTRVQFGLSMATGLKLGGFDVDVGVTPKFSQLRAAGLDVQFSDRFDDAAESIKRQFDDSESVDNTFTMDVGASIRLQNLPVTLSAVGRNLVKESIKTKAGFLFETTPQLIVGGAFSLSSFTLTADMALNEAKLDNLETQIFAVGAEFSKTLLGLRAGISHDNARRTAATALSLGISLGPLHIGGRIADRSSAQAGAQLAFSF